MAPEVDEVGGATRELASELASELRRWLGSGLLQGESGAFHAWCDLDSGELSFEYPEITGYALNYLASLDDLSDDEFEAGKRAGAWLLDRVVSGNLAARDGWDQGAIYLFDLGMIATGLMNFGARVEDSTLTGAGVTIARDLHDHIAADGSVQSISPRGPSGGGRRGWSVDGEIHLVKLTQSLLLAESMGAATMDERVETMINRMKALQADEGWFPTQEEDGFVMLHPHHYAIEGMWIWGRARDDDDALERARAASDWAWRHQLETGGFPRAVIIDEVRADTSSLALEQWDVTAQAIRGGIATGLDADGLPRAVERLADGAVREIEPGAALLYQPQAEPHANAWATMFAAQALAMVAGANLSWKALV